MTRSAACSQRLSLIRTRKLENAGLGIAPGTVIGSLAEMGLSRWFRRQSPLEQAIDRGLSPGGSIKSELSTLEKTPLQSRSDAEAICRGLEGILANPQKQPGGLSALMRLIQSVESAEAPAIPVLRRKGIPLMKTVVDEALAHAGRFDPHEVLLVLKVIAFCGHPDSCPSVIRAAKAGFHSESYLWSVIFKFYDKTEEDSPRLFAELSEDIPAGFLGIALMDAANDLLLDGGTIRHPFDSDEGMGRIRQWLSDPAEEHFSYAGSCTTALPFLSHPQRNEMLALAMNHPSPDVHLEAAWAAAKLDHPLGLEKMSAFCTDVRHSRRAQTYLKELHLETAIPALCLEPSFQARAEFADWLAHPNELGRPPDEVEIIDHRTLPWPPSFEPRPVWLIRFLARASDPLKDDDEGAGMVGSTTFCFFSSDLDQRPPEDGYAIHCYWELEHEKLLTDDAVTSAEYDSLFEQWTGGPLEERAMAWIAEISPELKYPRRLIGVASARRNNEAGWVVLDGPDSEWFPRTDFPDGDSAQRVLKIHLGRRLLNLGTTSKRSSFFRPKTAKPPEVIIDAYESLLNKAEHGEVSERKKLLEERGPLGDYFDTYVDAVIATRGGRRAEHVASLYERLLEIAKHPPIDPVKVHDSFSPLGDCFSAYVDATCELDQRHRILELIPAFEPHMRHNLGYSVLGRAAFLGKDNNLAEAHFLKLKAGTENWKQCPEMASLAEIWANQDREKDARDLLLECLKNEVEEAKEAWVQDRPIHEKQFGDLRETFTRLFPSASLAEHGIPEELFQEGKPAPF